MNGLCAQTRIASLFLMALLVAGCSATKPMLGSWKQVSNHGDSIQVAPWNWASVIPQDTPRAELISAVIPGESLARWVPNFQGSRFHLVSNNPAGHCRIINVEGRTVSNFGELNAALAEVQDVQDPIQVDYVGPDQRTAAFEVSVSGLNQVAQAIAPDQGMLRVSEDDNPWVLLRDGPVRCKVTARVERTRGVMHLAVSLCNCDPKQQMLLPLEIKATCEGMRLHCLNVAQSLDLLYRPDRKRDVYGDDQLSFAKASEQDEYLIPTNYRRLESELKERKMVSMPVPALATIPGEVYPGPALLGDARALGSFMLQRELFAPGEPERTGWVMFTGKTLSQGSHIEVDIDLGNGPRRLKFKIPQGI